MPYYNPITKQYYDNTEDYEKIIDENREFFKLASKIIYQNKAEFENYIYNEKKLQAVKSLKEYSGGGLKECKYAYELYLIGRLPDYVVEARRKKLEKLGKSPLVKTIIDRLKNIEDDKLYSMLMDLSFNELIEIDEKLTDKN